MKINRFKNLVFHENKSLQKYLVLPHVTKQGTELQNFNALKALVSLREKKTHENKSL